MLSKTILRCFMPILSVITGAYNATRCPHFEKSIMSILEQSFSDFEFIICDDGSTDQTYEQLLRFAETDGRIKLLKSDKNEGLAATLNKCLAVATGKYVARHDCDDFSAKDRFEKQIAYLEAHPAVDILGSAAHLFDESGVWGLESFPREVKNEDFLFTSPYKHGAVMFRRDALLKANGYRVSKETRRTEDYDLFMRMQVFCKGENLPEPLYDFCEDAAAKGRRKYRYRVDEAKVRAKGFRSLGLMPKGIPYVVKPLIVGLIPAPLLSRMQNKRRAAFNRTEEQKK